LPSSVEGRGNYKGMGLGLFIAKTLLERSGARLSFANGSDPFLKPTERPERSGAVVTLVWPLDRITVPADAALGENRRIEP
jgi:two-component system sensor histidine kinase RegB